MKIAHIAPPWIAVPPKNYGGTENVLYNLIENQVAQGHDVTLFATADSHTSAKLVSFVPQSLLEAGVPWQGHLKAYYHLHKAVEYIKEHEKDCEFDIVHTHLSSASDMYLFPLISQLTTPQVVTLHSPFPFDKVNSWTGDADSLYMEWASMVPAVAISDYARREVKYPLNFVGVVHHGLPMEQFQPMTLQPENYFVWLGRMVPDKGTHLAIQAAKKAGVKLVLAGTVDSYSDQSVKYFEEIIKPEIDDEQIKYIGPVNMRQKIDLLSHAAGFLNPIQWEEPFGMVLIEAMALGCPVISLSRGAAAEIVVHYKTGFLAHDIDDMVKFISRIGEIDRIVVRAHVVCNFSAHAMAEKYSRIYKRVIVMHKLDDVVSIPIAKSAKTRIPIITPPPVVVKKGDTVRVPYRARAASRATVEAETMS